MTKNLPLKAIGFGVIALLIVVLGAFISFQALNVTSEKELVVGEFVGGLTTMSIMRAQSLWEKYNVKVTVKSFTTPNALATALMNGEVDVTTGTPETYAKLNSNGTINFYIIGVEYTLLQQIVVKNDSGITSIQDLAGKKIGVLKASGTYALFQSFMDQIYGISDVETNFFSEVVNGFPGALIDSLARGDIDAAILWEPDISKAKAQYPSFKTLVTFEDLYRQASNTTDTAPMVLWFASKKAVETKSSLIKKFLDSQKEAVEIIRNQAESAKQAFLADTNLGLTNESVEILYSAVKGKFMEYTLTASVKDSIRAVWKVFYNGGQSFYLTEDPSKLPDTVFWSP